MTTEELRAIGEEATAGPWVTQLGQERLPGYGGNVAAPLWLVTTEDDRPETWTAVAETGFDRPRQNTTFIVAARNHWDAMLDVIEAAEAVPVTVGHPSCVNLRAALARWKEMER